jgi:hypothetical protein
VFENDICNMFNKKYATISTILTIYQRLRNYIYYLYQGYNAHYSLILLRIIHLVKNLRQVTIAVHAEIYISRQLKTIFKVLVIGAS